MLTDMMHDTRVSQEPKAHPHSTGPQAPPKSTDYPDLDEDDLNDSEDQDDEEMLLAEPSTDGSHTSEVEEGDCIFVTMYAPPEIIGTMSTISQQITEESVKDNLKQEKSLHDMVSPCFWDHIDVFLKKSFDSLPQFHPWDHTIKLTSDHQSPH